LASEQAVIEVFNQGGEGPFVLTCEHATNKVPEEFGNLGLDDALLETHIAWDPGARPVAEALARLLDAPLIMPAVSRLVCDCNRPHGSADATPVRSEIYEIPGNRDLTPEQREARARRFYEPFREAVDRTLRHRLQSCGAAILVTIHSFTPIFKGKVRDIQLGILHDADSRLADAMLRIVEKEAELIVGRNQPYGPEDGVTHTLRFHALPLGLLNVMIEIRNDLIGDRSEQVGMARRLAGYLQEALASIGTADKTVSHA
jgi:predicted N-formylglutamate amidohydrolase